MGGLSLLRHKSPLGQGWGKVEKRQSILAVPRLFIKF
jgi:hypothetical protein